EAADLLEAGDTRRVFTHSALGEDPEVVFMFPGGGAQFPGMARDLYETEPVFAEWMDRGLDHLQTQLDYDIRVVWLPEADDADKAAERLKRPSVQLPLIAIVEYALAQLWLSWGIKPAAMIGHSMGENVAACLAGVMSFENLIDLVLLRGRLFDEVPAGGMLSISAPLAGIEPLLGDDLDIASINAPELIAVSGSDAALDGMQKRLDAAGLEHQRIAIDIAAHSRMLEPILGRYRDFLAGLDLQPPQQPVISNRTGNALTADEATNPDYWVGQLRNTVHFADGIETLSARPARVYLEVGPGKALSALAQMNGQVSPGQVISTLRHPDHAVADDLYFVSVIGRLWACGIEADWSQIWGEARRNRLRLPTYRFQRSRYFIEPGKAMIEAPAPILMRQEEMEDWGYVPHWKPCYVDVPFDVAADLGEVPLTWLIFADEAGRAAHVIDRLRGAGHRVATLTASDSFARKGPDSFTLAPEQGRMGYDQLFAALAGEGAMPDRIAHFWLADDLTPPRPGSSRFDRNLEQGFWSLTWLAQTLAEAAPETPIHLTVFTSGAAQVRDETLDNPEKALVQGPVGVLPREVTNITAALVDLPALAVPEAQPGGWFKKAEPTKPQTEDPLPLLQEMCASSANTIAAHRDGTRYQKTWRQMPLPEAQNPAFRVGGTYLITGGFGGIGQTLAADILRTGGNVILLSRRKMPEATAWKGYLARHGSADATARRIQAAQRLQAIGDEQGAILEVAEADVANLAQMRRAIEGITARHGALTGVIHAAGTLDDAPLLSKTHAQIDAVLTPKVQGLRVLDQLLPDGTVELMVLFSSTSTATRAAGQVDYVAANAWLDAFAAARKGGETRIVTLNWGIWSEVGMAAKALPGGTQDTLPPRPVDAAMIEAAGTGSDGVPRLTASLSTADWVLDQHRTRDGQALLPGTGFVELLAEAASVQGITAGFEIRDLYFLRALPLQDGENRELRITLNPDHEGMTAEIRSACTLDGKSGWQLHAQAALSTLNAARPAPLPLAEISARCAEGAKAAPAKRLQAPQEAQLNFGTEWHVLRETALGDAEGLAMLSLPTKAKGTDQILHAGLMDIATGWAMTLAPGYDPSHLWVPVSYGQIRVFAPLPKRIHSWVRLSDGVATDGFARFDVTLTDPDGEILVEVTDFAMKRLEEGLQSTPLSPSEVTFDEEQGNQVLTPAEERLAYLVSQGIRASEGPEALRRALSMGRSQVVVSSMPLPDLIAQADLPLVEAKSAGQSFERHDLDGTFVAPRTPIEAELAEIWEGLLGVCPVGVEDSFFDLGGHSLIAVRLFAAIKRAFKVEFPISVLFEAPTIEKCATLIAAEVGEGAVSETAEAQQAEKYEYLVPLNQNTDAGAIPLFIVAGMFGNVLNLRHLALPFNDERPVYGIQARGLIGDQEPHRDVVDAARDYLVELRRRQPEGPYLLSGYSGGGVVAFEMAQQLRAAGQEVAVMAFLDTLLPVRPTLGTADKVLIKLAELRRKGPAYIVEWIRDRRAWKQMQAATHAEADGGDDTEFNNDKIADAFLEAMEGYGLHRWDGPATLFRPPLEQVWQVTGGRWVSSKKEFVTADNDWTTFAPNLEVIEVPGDHDSMVLAPNVTVLAQELGEIIARALGDADAPWKEATAAE
ncbi:MAG: KR domain-containing protein, partial [Sulfitobacter sp.]|nr:KR domain-containing protein [Sulfitobacter sp.]